jgi:hypothetical protein
VDLASLPTDSLYKFVALSGVALALLSFYLLVTRSLHVWERVDQLSFLSARVGVELDVVEKNVERAKAQPTLSDAEHALMGRKIARIKKLHANEKVRLEIARRLTAELHRLVLIAGIATALGIIVASAGFRLWYTRSQAPQDELLRLQVEQARAASTPATTSRP